MSTSFTKDLAGELRRRLRNVASVVDDVAALLDDGPEPAYSALEDLARRVLDVDRLRRNLEQAASTLAALEAHAAWEARYGESSWDTRRLDLEGTLARDRDAGTDLWLRTAVDALSQGAWSEVMRLGRHSFSLATGAAWYQDRWLSAVLALSNTAQLNSFAPTQLLDIVEWCLESRTLAPEQRAALGILGARVLARVRDQSAVDVLRRAELAIQEAAPSRTVELRYRLLAASSYLDRVLGIRDLIPAPPSGWELALSGAAENLDCAAELAARGDGHGAADNTDGPMTVLPVLPALARGVASLAGLRDRLRALVDELPSELTLEFAARLLDEDRTDDARALLADVSASNASVALRRAELVYETTCRLDLPQGGDEAAADAATEAGRWALAADLGEQAVRWFREALGLRPHEADRQRELADALVYATWTLPPKEAEPQLEEALVLCADAEKDSLLTSENQWALLVQANAEYRLSEKVSARRPFHLWAAVGHAARYVMLNPASPTGWMNLGDRLSTASGGYAAAAVIARAHALAPGNYQASLAQAVAAINIGDGDRATLILDEADIPADVTVNDNAWRLALFGMAARASGRYVQAAEHIEKAIQLDPQLEFRLWLAECFTLMGDGLRADTVWRAVWREAPLVPDNATPVHLGAAAWSALYHGQTKSASDLAKALNSAEAATVEERASAFVTALVRLAHGEYGEEPIRDAFHWINVPRRLADQAILCRQVLQHAVASRREQGDDVTQVDLPRALAVIDRCAAERQRQIAHLGTAEDTVDEELSWLERILATTPASAEAGVAIDRVRKALRARQPVEFETPGEAEASEVTEGEGTSEEAADAAHEAVVRIATPPSWFAKLEGREMEHPMFVRASPDARAAVERRDGADPDVQIRVRVEEALEPDSVLIEVVSGQSVLVHLRRDLAYVPLDWRYSLDDARRGFARHDHELPLLTVPPSSDALQRLCSWSAEETAFRLALLLNVGLGLDVGEKAAAAAPTPALRMLSE
ncbi:hypothetical protein ACWEF6_00520 [Amycolatopsis sp. NPDC004772]